jgi:MtN3 and saliva related transmembrane protein
VDTATIVGAAATLCSVSSFVPQAWKVIRTRDTRGISGRMYVITVIGFSLWFSYGLLLGQWPLILTNGICLLLSGFILLMKLLPRNQREGLADALDPMSSGMEPAPRMAGNAPSAKGIPPNAPGAFR